MTLSIEEQKRYSRHLVMPDVGARGQALLGKGRVLVIGAGGLGSPALMYLAAAGIGTIGIADDDVVDLSNLQRQILYTTTDIGKGKARLAAGRLHAMNPHIRTEIWEERLDGTNAGKIIGSYDVVLDCTDNFGTRYLVNDACVLLNKPDIYGAVFRFGGQVAVFDASRGSCLRCLNPVPPPDELVLGCADGGVIGAVAGLIGSFQALEAVKIIVGTGTPGYGRLLSVDGMSGEMMWTSIMKNPSCPVCGAEPTIRDLSDNRRYHRMDCDDGIDAREDVITPVDLQEMMKRGDPVILLDVRSYAERDTMHIGGFHIPVDELPARTTELDPDSRLVIYCRGDARSSHAVEYLRRKGFRSAVRLLGGIDAFNTISERAGE